MQYILNDEVFYKEINGEFLAYSGQSGETMLLHGHAFHILKRLVQPCSSLSLLEILINESSNDDSGIDPELFLRDTLHELVDRGFINASNPLAS